MLHGHKYFVYMNEVLACKGFISDCAGLRYTDGTGSTTDIHLDIYVLSLI